MTEKRAEMIAARLATHLVKGLDYTALWLCRPLGTAPYTDTRYCVMIVWPDGGSYWIGLGTEREIAAVIESAYEARGASA